MEPGPDNADGDRDATTGGDDPWDFGTATEYPVLQADFDGDGTATWREFGEQRPNASPPAGGGSSNDATLKALGVSPVDIEGFAADVLAYHIGVANAVSQVTVTPYPGDDGRPSTINGNTVSGGSGHTVSLAEGSNEITITVTAQDGTTTTEYSIAADRGSDAPFGWKVTEDFNDLGLAEEIYPVDIWGSRKHDVGCVFGECMDSVRYPCLSGLPREPRGVPMQIQHLHQGTGCRRFPYTGNVENYNPRGIAANSITMYVADYVQNKVFAYSMATYARDPSKEINELATARNIAPKGIALHPGAPGCSLQTGPTRKYTPTIGTGPIRDMS